MIVRDSDIGVQVFMMKRSLRSSFGGIWVFPGGILEDQDQDIAKKNYCNGIDEKKAKAILNYDQESLTYWIASLRETFEETGALIANRDNNSFFTPTEDEAINLERLRSDLNNGKISFISILKQLKLKIALERLIYISHWITPDVETKRYTTRFFLTSLNEEVTMTHDDLEGTDSKWIGINEALEAHKAGRISLIMPTIKNLESISSYKNTQELISAKNAIKAKDIPAIEPKFFKENGQWKGLLPGEYGYEDH
tara:strand:+ start:262 stop:1020 length:759 start_codon:yes stop_codon:yes gene_type:complete